jgi:hypothetical protein
LSGVARIVYDTSGTDVSSSALSLLTTNRSIWMADLFWFKIYDFWSSNNYIGNSVNYTWTTAAWPILVNTLQTGINGTLTTTGGQTYLPAAIKRRTATYKVGFEDNPFDLTWYTNSVTVPAFAQPWSVAGGLNASYPIGSPNGGPATSIPVIPGKSYTLKWSTGLCSAYYNGPYFTPAGDPAVPSPGGGSPITGFNAEALVGGWADATGQLVATPLRIGSYWSGVAPTGATQLLLGFNDGGTFSDNSGAWIIEVTGQYILTQNSLSLKQAMAAGYCDGAPFWYHKAIFNAATPPIFGPGSLLGTTLMMRGYLRDVEVADDHVKITIASLMESFNQVKVPTQLIQPGNRSVQIIPPQPTAVLGNVLSTSTATDIQITTSSYPDHEFQGGFIIFGGYSTYVTANASGATVPSFIRIRDNVTLSGTLHLYPMEPIIGNLAALSPVTAWALSSLDNSSGAPGFPYVPGPDHA